MADSLNRPWILKYAIEVAEQYGAKLADVSPNTKKHRVQLVEFLTFQRSPEDVVWAVVSDKYYRMPIRFTKDAIVRYNQATGVDDSNSLRLTARKHSIALIKDFRLFFARVPLGNDKGMGKIERLALEVNYIEVTGSAHEGVFGEPRNLEDNEDVRLWTTGLKEDGGGGNVLKLAKQEKEREISGADEAEPSNAEAGPSRRPLPAALIAPGKPKSRPTAKKTAEQTTISPRKKQENEELDGKMEKVSGTSRTASLDENPAPKLWKESWRTIARNPQEFSRKPKETMVQLLDVLVFGRDLNNAALASVDIVPPHSLSPPKLHASISHDPMDLGPSSQMSAREESVRATTPSTWEASDAEDTDLKTPNKDKDGYAGTGLESEDNSNNSDMERGEAIADAGAEATTMPAQVNGDDTNSSSLLLLSPAPLTSASLLFPAPAQRLRPREPYLLPSSMQPPKQRLPVADSPGFVTSTSSAVPASSASQSDRPVRVLVPDSDTSGTASQSQSQPQSLSLTQSQPQARSSQLQSQSQSQSRSLRTMSQNDSDSQTQPESQISISKPSTTHSAVVQRKPTVNEEPTSKNVSLAPKPRRRSPHKKSTMTTETSITASHGHAGPSTTLDNGPRDSQESRTQESRIEEAGGNDYEDDDDVMPGAAQVSSLRADPGSLDFPEADPLEHDDFQTHVMLHHGTELGPKVMMKAEKFGLLGEVTKLRPRSKSDSVKSDISAPKRHQHSAPSIAQSSPGRHRMAKSPSLYDDLPQSSPSAHLGKRARFSPTREETSPMGSDLDLSLMSHRRPTKKLRQISSPTFTVEAVAHDTVAWKTASFIQNQKKTNKTMKERADDGSAQPSKSISATTAPKDEAWPPKRTRSSASALTKLSHAAVSQDQEAHVEVGDIRSKGPKSRKVLPRASSSIMEPIRSASASSSRESKYALRKLGGFTVNFDLRKGENGIPWLNWQDTADILQKIGING